MPTDLFFKPATSAVSGTLPSTTASVSATAPTWVPGQTNTVVATPVLTNRVMDQAVPVSGTPTQLAYTTDNVTTDQKQPLLRFISPPLSAQTINAGGQTFSIGIAGSEANINSDFFISLCLVLWRPSTGALITRLHDSVATARGNEPPAGSFTLISTGSITITNAATALMGDVLVLEIWRSATIQQMATSYTNTLAYDSTPAIYQDALSLSQTLSFPVLRNLTGAAAGMATVSGAVSKLVMPTTALAGPVDAFN